MGHTRESQLKVFRTTQEFRTWRMTVGPDLGFVPTMGNLHAGHLSLLETSLHEHQVSVCSIFVNPTQFGPHDDFNRYPRTLEQDLKLIEESQRRHPGREVVVFAPQDPQEIYPAGFGTSIQVNTLDGFLEGELRPGHFTGVATVVYLLFLLVKPRTAYFGRKDYQQYRIIKKMVKDLELPIRIKGMPIVRDQNGLALSSRNQYLNQEQIKESLTLINTLKEVERRLGKEGQRVAEVRSWIADLMNRDTRWQYLEIRDARSLATTLYPRHKAVILGVLKVGSVRLLDNLEVELA